MCVKLGSSTIPHQGLGAYICALNWAVNEFHYPAPRACCIHMCVKLGSQRVPLSTIASWRALSQIFDYCITPWGKILKKRLCPSCIAPCLNMWKDRPASLAPSLRKQTFARHRLLGGCTNNKADRPALPCGGVKLQERQVGAPPSVRLPTFYLWRSTNRHGFFFQVPRELPPIKSG